MDVVYGDTAISGIFKEPAVTVTMYGRKISQGEKMQRSSRIWISLCADRPASSEPCFG